MNSRESSPSFVELPVLPTSRRISAARRHLTTPTTLAKDDGGAEGDRPLSQSGETDEASQTHHDSSASLQNSHSQAHSGHTGDLSLDAASDRGSSGTPHSPALRSPASVVPTSAGPTPPPARRKLSTAASSSAAAVCDASLSSSSLTARRMWMHFAERDVLTAHRAASPTDMESSCPLGIEPLPPSRADTAHGSPWPSSLPTAKMAPLGVTKTAYETISKSSCTRSPSLPPSPEASGSILLPRSSARRPSAALQLDAPRDFPPVQVDATRAAVAEERALSTSFSPSTPPSTPFKQDDGAATPAAGEEKGLANFLPALHTTSASWCEEKDSAAHFHGAPATLSFPTRLRLHQSGLLPPRRLSQQVSLSFECAEDEKTMTSTTNSESLPPHGLSPSSAVPSDAQSSVPFFSDLLWRARASRVDLRSPPSSTHSSQRQELEAQPPRSSSAMLVERRVSLPTPALQPLDQPETLCDFDRASSRAWHVLNEPPPRTRSAVYSATPRRIRDAHLVPPVNDANHLARSTGGYARSATSHSARCAVAAPRSASQRSTRATTLTADAPCARASTRSSTPRPPPLATPAGSRP